MPAGLEPHPVAGLFVYLYLDTCPPSLQNSEIASLPAVHALRPAAAEMIPTARPEWLDQLDGLPIVYVTMGTVWNRDVDLFARVVAALCDEPIALVVTVGQRNDPAVLGPQPNNVVVRRYIPQGELLPHCQAVVTHGGSGTTLGALAHGLPLLVVPQGADQYANADAVVAAGAGRRLGGDETTVAAIRDSVRSLLDNPPFAGLPSTFRPRSRPCQGPSRRSRGSKCSFHTGPIRDASLAVAGANNGDRTRCLDRTRDPRRSAACWRRRASTPCTAAARKCSCARVVAIWRCVLPQDRCGATGPRPLPRVDVKIPIRQGREDRERRRNRCRCGWSG